MRRGSNARGKVIVYIRLERAPAHWQPTPRMCRCVPPQSLCTHENAKVRKRKERKRKEKEKEKKKKKKRKEKKTKRKQKSTDCLVHKKHTIVTTTPFIPTEYHTLRTSHTCTHTQHTHTHAYLIREIISRVSCSESRIANTKLLSLPSSFRRDIRCAQSGENALRGATRDCQ